ncbi:uncharacterized protein EAF01_011919 [Botrytis porri]|uniref:Uncharacterized protein n=1 Tax=Botrytis porri TaxID=87229 RepID=A0A4Z1L1L8_9HELO|nr:uncharacterized protein EAF01_011919 [Botrytis porri]KAF7880754.1 hypothetical protein EAF01_011919 [Botrytis porri]TGO90708.1 hypothetical protein BPOR_0054g00190 [Botrytis porri]
MPPKQKPRPKGSAPANRTYKAVEPLRQTTFPEKKKRITRNYGKKSKLKLEDQDTLTQMDWVKLHEREELEKQMEDDIEDSEGDYVEEDSKRRTKRRRTMGDETKAKKKKVSKNRRKTLGEEGRTPSFSTQTITQLDYWPLSGARKPEEPEDDPSIYDIPVSSSPAFQPLRRSPRKFSNPATSDPAQLMPPPQTPRHRKILEIPSSQSPATPMSSQFRGSARKRSPLKEQSTNVIVPFSLRSSTFTSAERIPKLKIEDTYETGTDESQVLLTPSKHSSPAKTVRFAIPDSSQESLAEDTPLKEEHATSRDFSPSPIRRLGTPAPRKMKFEILDSDAEDEEDEESQVVADTPPGIIPGYEDLTNVRGSIENTAETPEQDEDRSADDTIRQTEGDVEQELELPETFYGDIGAETQFQAERIMPSSSLSDIVESTPLSDDAAGTVSYGSSQLPKTQYATTQHTQTQTRRTGTQYTQKQTQFGKSQYPESQRLSTQHLDAMAPRSDSSDVFISIYPTTVETIISREKNHEFRSYGFPATVSRIWIYQTRPRSTLTHMAVIGPPKAPGDITKLDGLGNSEFNKGEKRSKFAYEILELYALANPMTLEELKSRQWFKAAPQKYNKVPPAVLGELIANLLPPLFTQSSSAVENIPPASTLHRKSSTSTESQEVLDQITNNIQQFSHIQAPSASPPSSPPSSPPIATQTPVIHVPSSQRRFVRPSQASTVDYTQTQTPVTPRRLRHERKETPIPEMIPESPAKSIPSSSRGSSPVQSLTPVVSRRGERMAIEIECQSDDEDELEEDSLPVKAARRESAVIEIESQIEGENEDESDVNNEKDNDHHTGNEENEVNHIPDNDPIKDEGEQESYHPSSTPAPYSLIRSSQLMSRSQMMREQDSLIDREIMGPPPPPTDVAPKTIVRSMEMETSCKGYFPETDDDDDEL